MKARLWMGALVAIAVIAVATYVVQTRKPAQTAVKPTVPEPVDVELSLQAVLQTATSIPVGVPVEGKIESFQVEAGDEVYEGQLLAQIKSQALETAKLEAETDLEQSETRVRNLEAAMSAARLEASRAVADAARVKNEYERAAKNFQREKMLLAEGATPRRNFEKAQKEFIALEAETKNHDAVAAGAEERITSTQNELDAARKLLEGKSEDLEQATQRVGAGNVLSPVNGIVVGRRGQAGDNVHPSMTDLFQIATDLSAMQAVAQASPAQIKQIKPGQPATVTIVEMAGEILQGSVLKIEGDRVVIEFANPNPLIKPGLTAQVRIKLT
ncbi:MAG TPA: efflux RND transporter periplasmic adaptor subunit [Bryobacteraceae bacterium]|nr:efflux RND transporter periplasmic adaptor subunit [Bryobacteraceae bacterium]